jgi:hypothetical protein
MHTYSFAQHIREQDIVYSRYIVREINLRHARNKVLFGNNTQLPVILLDGLKQGAKAFTDTDHTKQIDYDQVMEKLLIAPTEDSCALSFYMPEELYILELTEQFIFDKNTSEFRFIPTDLTLFIPANISSKGIMEPVAVFPFEICTRIFKNDARAFSCATTFGQLPVNFNEQFVIRSYVSTIVKIGNKEDLYFDQQYADPYRAFMAMKKEEELLQEMMYAAYNPTIGRDAVHKGRRHSKK